VGNPLTLSSTRGIPLNAKLVRVVQDAVRQQSETGYPQAIILSGEHLINLPLKKLISNFILCLLFKKIYPRQILTLNFVVFLIHKI